jgi:PAS domain S-box-containing protein
VQQAVIATDPRGRITHWNRFAERLYGWSAAEVLGRPVVEVTPAQETAEEAAAIMARLLEGDSWRGEMRVRRKDGTAFVAEVTDSPVRDATGRLTGVVGVSHDVTERRRLEDQLRQAQKMEAVGRLAGGVAHDFNNLLTAIKGYADLLLDDLPEGNPARDDVAEIRAAAQRAAELTRQLLAFSLRQVLQPRLVDMNGVVTSLEKMLRRLIAEDVELVQRLAPSLGAVWADPGQLDQVVINLAVNARDAMPRGGRLTIETGNVVLSEAGAAHHPSGLAPGAYVALRVTDTGHGMDEDTLARIFEPFFTTRDGVGTGLGLATVYGIVQQSGGRVWAESSPGRGATFHVWLPRAQSEVGADADAPAAAPLRAGGSETVLLVEDEDGVRALAGRILRRCGYQVVDAANGRDAIDVAARHPGPIHLLLTDVVMPGMSGADLATRLTAINPALRVLFMSGYPGDALAQHGLTGERLQMITKPFPADRLASRVREVLDAAAR